MNDVLNRVLLASADARITWIPWNRYRPEPRQRLGFSVVLLHMASGFVWAGVSVFLLSRGLLGRWSLTAFLVPGIFGALAAGLWFGMIRLAWNRRAGALELDSAAGRPSPEAVQASRWERRVFLPLLGLAVLVAAGALVVAMENVRGTWRLRSVENDFRARGLPVAISEVEPPAVPEERNLALAPFLKPLFEYNVALPSRPQTNGGAVRWADPEAFTRIHNLFRVESPSQSFSAFVSNYRRTNRDPASASAASSSAEPIRESWIDGGTVALPLWQAYYRSWTNWDAPTEPRSPARDVLSALGLQESSYQQLKSAAADRPQCRFPIRYGDGPLTLIPHLAPVKHGAQYLRLRSVALLAEGRTDEALADTLLGFQWSDGLRGEPILISLLVRMATDALVLQPVWEGCRDRRWSEAQLSALQRVLEGRDYLAELRGTLMGERVLAGVTYDNLVRGRSVLNPWNYAEDVGEFSEDAGLKLFVSLMPRGWIRQSQVAHIRYVQALVDDLASARSHAELAPPGRHLEHYISRKSLFHVLAALLAPGSDGASGRTYEMEAWRRLAVTGLALERFRLAEGRYPDSLAALAPRFVNEVPLDPMDGHPLRYRVEPDGQFRLYSVGRDHQDDGGRRPERRARSAADRKRASDQVWR